MPTTSLNYAQTLARVPIFSGLSEEELGFFVQRAVPRQFTSGEIVFSEGERCLGLYVVASGHVRIFKTSGAGREQVLSIDGPGNSIAEVPVFDSGTYHTTVCQ
jgi:CRP/FNR family transcriptional regulator